MLDKLHVSMTDVMITRPPATAAAVALEAFGRKSSSENKTLESNKRDIPKIVKHLSFLDLGAYTDICKRDFLASRSSPTVDALVNSWKKSKIPAARGNRFDGNL